MLDTTAGESRESRTRFALKVEGKNPGGEGENPVFPRIGSDRIVKKEYNSLGFKVKFSPNYAMESLFCPFLFLTGLKL